MNTNDLKQLLATYGSKPENWPPDRRQDALALVESDESAHALLALHAPLDRALDRVATAPNLRQLEAAILQQLPSARREGLLDRIINWLTPDPDAPGGLFRPALAAMLPLVVGIVLGGNISLESLESTDISYSADEEIVLLSLAGSETESLP